MHPDDSMMGKLVGLAGGFYNNDTSDDLRAPNGTVLPANATDRQIHTDFGQKCKNGYAPKFGTYLARPLWPRFYNNQQNYFRLKNIQTMIIPEGKNETMINNFI